MGLVKANFKTRGATREKTGQASDPRDEFEKQVLAQGAKGSFMVFMRPDKKDTPLIASGVD